MKAGGWSSRLESADCKICRCGSGKVSSSPGKRSSRSPSSHYEGNSGGKKINGQTLRLPIVIINLQTKAICGVSHPGPGQRSLRRPHPARCNCISCSLSDGDNRGGYSRPESDAQRHPAAVRDCYACSVSNPDADSYCY